MEGLARPPPGNLNFFLSQGCSNSPFSRTQFRARSDDLGDRGKLVHETHFQGLFGFLVLALQNHRGGVAETDQARRPLGAAGARQQADVDLGKTKNGARVIGQDPVVTGQADFESATQG